MILTTIDELYRFIVGQSTLLSNLLYTSTVVALACVFSSTRTSHMRPPVSSRDQAANCRLGAMLQRDPSCGETHVSVNASLLTRAMNDCLHSAEADNRRGSVLRQDIVSLLTRLRVLGAMVRIRASK